MTYPEDLHEQRGVAVSRAFRGASEAVAREAHFAYKEMRLMIP